MLQIGDATAILVRLHSSTRLLQLVPDDKRSPLTTSTPFSIQDVAILTTEDTGGRRQMDVVLDHNSYARALIADETGGIWLWSDEVMEKADRKTKIQKL